MRYSYLHTNHLSLTFKRVDHEAATTMAACEDIDTFLGTYMCKNLFLCNRQKTRFYLLLMPGNKKFKTKELSNQINTSRLSFADAEDMLKYLDIEPGAVSVMGLMNDKDLVIQLLIDDDLKKDDYIGCHPCVCTSSMKIKSSDIFDIFLPAVGHEPEIVHLVGED